MVNGRRVRGRRRYQMIDDIKIYGSYEETKRKAENRKDWRELGLQNVINLADKFRATECTERKKSLIWPTKVTEDAGERMQRDPNKSVKKLARREIRTHDQRPAREHIARASRGKGKGAYTRGEAARAAATQRSECGTTFPTIPEVRRSGDIEIILYTPVEISRNYDFAIKEEAPVNSSRVFSYSVMCVRICVSIRRPEFECSGPQLEGPEVECSGPQLEGPEFEYSELSLKLIPWRYSPRKAKTDQPASGLTPTCRSRGGRSTNQNGDREGNIPVHRDLRSIVRPWDELQVHRPHLTANTLTTSSAILPKPCTIPPQEPPHFLSQTV
ncbi:hypothetical protein ANN_11233 [Periplaneta americana]|uniref:Uncharacterized protein n=1 Tax=Periplaneta americana TaxID=6978 RepID=A0ABQ8T5Z8_PERAM|nr:hypothetical protein ANN_11233 [Periplaneta americana]